MSALDFIGGVAVFILCVLWWAVRKISSNSGEEEDDGTWPTRPMSSVIANRDSPSQPGGVATKVKEEWDTDCGGILKIKG